MLKITILAFVIALLSISISAQTTEFTYQGSLSIGSPPAPTTGTYDFEFRLFSVDTGGSAISTLQRLNISVSNGSFSAKLDFGAQFPGAVRYLEIGVRGAGGGSFITLSPRQQMSNTPYSVRSLNAATADSIPVGGLPAGSGNYIQNTSTPQASSNFSISGNGAVGGMFGIGTTTPQQRLSVSDGMNIDQNNLNSGTLTNTMRFGPGNSGEAIGSKRTTGGNIFGLDFYIASSNRMSITVDGNVGIGTANPSSKLHVFGNGVLRINADSDSNAGFGLSLNNQLKWSVATVNPGHFQIFNQSLVSNALWIDNATNNVGIGSTSPAATLEVNGYTKLGSDAPSIRVKKLIGTTAATEGGEVSISHGLDASKILSISIMVNNAPDFWVGPEQTYPGTLHFTWQIRGGSIAILNVGGNSGAILSKPIKIFITYEQ